MFPSFHRREASIALINARRSLGFWMRSPLSPRSPLICVDKMTKGVCLILFPPICLWGECEDSKPIVISRAGPVLPSTPFVR